MDGSRFDELVRSAATGASRRKVLGSAIVGLFALTRGAEADAASRRATGQVCRKHGDCVSEICLSPDATGRRRCGCSTSVDCDAPEGSCVDCVEGVCVGGEICANTEACLDGRCLLAYPNCASGGAECSSGIGVVLNGDSVNACLSDENTFIDCATTAECPAGNACIAFKAPDDGWVGFCIPGCRADI